MNEPSAIGNYYTLGHLTLFTGLTDRTLRNYLASGILQGEKTNGVWHFTPEQAQALITHPTARAAILAKKNAIIYDFLLNEHKSSNQCCLILDLPKANDQRIIEYFCNSINQGDFHDLQFSFDSISGMPRVILRGPSQQVLALANGYHASTDC
ncbi:MAG: hypothetical protein IKC28_12905 [Clostridia bacterium]|nr:hypothetical protein [Clostridia bacterium]